MRPERSGKRASVVHVAVVRSRGVQLVSGLFFVVSLSCCYETATFTQTATFLTVTIQPKYISTSCVG